LYNFTARFAQDAESAKLTTISFAVERTAKEKQLLSSACKCRLQLCARETPVSLSAVSAEREKSVLCDLCGFAVNNVQLQCSIIFANTRN